MGRATIIRNVRPARDELTSTGPSTLKVGRVAALGRKAFVLTDSPVAVALIAGAGGLVFVLLRLTVAAHGEISFFIVAGTGHSTPGLMHPPIIVVPNNGYDGQFYYRMALDPSDMALRAFGIELDSVSRLQRIGYPAISWLLAGGRASLVPDTLVVTNVLGLAAIGYGGALMARDSGRHALWGVTVVAFWGYLWTAGRDLTEITAAAFLILGLYAFRRERWLLAALLLLGAVLSKETCAYVVLVLAATRLVGWAVQRDRGFLTGADVAWVVPLVGFAGWQLVVFSVTGHLPLRSSGQANLGLPFEGVIDGFRLHVSGLPSTASAIWFVELAAFIVITVMAGLSLRSSSAPLHERLAWVAVVVLAVSTARGIWLGDVGFRSLDAVYLFSWLVLLGTSRRLLPLGGMVGLVWLGVAVELILYI